ncbi:MAG: hypothetical protein KGJ11_09565, partial [Candidatus Omnitrophica bacterium]|nr:hypothetical protein [Candidatus Omnitrophota bacterium]
MSTRRIIGGCVTAMMIFQLSPAYAFQWGQWEIKPWGSVEEQYDSNITYAHTDTISDSITVPRLGLEGIYTGKNYTADLNLSGQEEIYSRYHHYDNLSEYLTANYSRDFSYYDHLKVDDSFVHATDPTTFVAQFGRTNGRYEYYLNDFDAGWTHDFTDKTSIQYKLTDNYYDPKLSGLIESNRIKGGVEGAWEVISELKVLVYADYSWRQFAGLDSITKESVGGGLRYYWTPRIYLEGKAGEDFIQPTVGNTDINRPDFQVS